jgi:hypothetical protein
MDYKLEFETLCANSGYAPVPLRQDHGKKQRSDQAGKTGEMEI